MTEYNPVPTGKYRLAENHPMVSLILLLTLVFAGALVFGGISLFLAMALTGVEGLGAISYAMDGTTDNGNFLKIVQAGSSIGTFVVPAILLGIVERQRTVYLDFKTKVDPTLWLIVIALMFFSAPLLEQSIKLNERMQLPEALSGIENWMKAKEAEMEKLTHLMLSDTTYWGLFLNLIIVAVIPAIGEEFIFRGCLQNMMMRWLRNPHVAVWVTAIIFSAIHLQFYGFLPRLLLGVGFGYLLLWGKNIWLPVLAHFVNNASATISAFYLQRQGKSLDDMNFGDQIPPYLYFVSFVVTGLLLYQYRKTALTQKNSAYGEKLD